MKNYCILHILLFLILLLAYQCSAAQDFLATTRGDTIYGEIKPLTYGVDQKVQVTEAGKKKTVYSLVQIKSYHFKGETYQPVKGPTGYTFMKLIKPGYLSLYAFQLDKQVTYDGLFLLKKDGHGTEVPNLSFKKVIKNFLADCPDVVAKVDDGVLSKKQIELIVEEYNSCIERKTVGHGQIIARKVKQDKKISSWDTLEDKIKSASDFSGKSDALEMISEIKTKISKSEKVPNFLVEGLKSSLKETELKEDLEKAIEELKNKDEE